MAFGKLLEEYEKKRTKALQMGGPEKVKKQHDKGRLTARERIDRLLDPGSFMEMGLFAHSGLARDGRGDPRGRADLRVRYDPREAGWRSLPTTSPCSRRPMPG